MVVTGDTGVACEDKGPLNQVSLKAWLRSHLMGPIQSFCPTGKAQLLSPLSMNYQLRGWISWQHQEF